MGRWAPGRAARRAYSADRLSDRDRAIVAEDIDRVRGAEPDPSLALLLATVDLRTLAHVAEHDEHDAGAAYLLALALQVQHRRSGDSGRWMRVAAERGEPAAALQVAMPLMKRRRHAEALPFLRQAADAGVPDADLLLATCLIKEGLIDEAKSWARKAATQGNGQAAALLAMAAVSRGDHSEWMRWEELATEAKDPETLLLLGDFYNRVDIHQAFDGTSRGPRR